MNTERPMCTGTRAQHAYQAANTEKSAVRSTGEHWTAPLSKPPCASGAKTVVFTLLKKKDRNKGKTEKQETKKHFLESNITASTNHII